jgi:hypothetical protein
VSPSFRNSSNGELLKGNGLESPAARNGLARMQKPGSRIIQAKPEIGSDCERRRSEAQIIKNL